MLTVQVKLNIDDVISSLQDLDNYEREKLQNALFELQNDMELREAIQEGLDDIKHGRVSSHESVMAEIKAKYNY
jgi:predicted transcriptional regulator